ncbi:MAG: hypothetical protein ACR652_00085 [Methylocystis sp.]|uniref:hypothetical protein n=1 Tax=Methylocystis sp. TaxID=1911079 RepID=UPI003DA200EC
MTRQSTAEPSVRLNFFGPNRAYHDARQHFVFKGNPRPPREARGARAGIAADVPQSPVSSIRTRPDVIAMLGLFQKANASQAPELEQSAESQNDHASKARLQALIQRGIIAAKSMFGVET